MPASKDPYPVISPVVIHDHPRDQSAWHDRVTLATLAALIDKLGEGQRLYFTFYDREWRVVNLKPDTARFGMVGGHGVVDLRGHKHKSRGRLVADEMRRYHELKTRAAVAADFQLISIDLVRETVYPHPTGCLLCNECEGSGTDVLFQVPRDCEACNGTGWKCAHTKQGSSENDNDNETETAPGKTRPPESEKGES
jgi:hypothetical protein